MNAKYKIQAIINIVERLIDGGLYFDSKNNSNIEDGLTFLKLALSTYAYGMPVEYKIYLDDAYNVFNALNKAKAFNAVCKHIKAIKTNI